MNAKRRGQRRASWMALGLACVVGVLECVALLKARAARHS